MSSGEAYQDFLGEEVVDAEGWPVGRFVCYWEHEEDKPVLLGIHCNGDEKRTHVAPAKGSRLNESQTYISVPHARAMIQKAPSLECGCELDAVFEERVCEYYGLPLHHLPTRRIDNIREELKRVYGKAPPGTR